MFRRKCKWVLYDGTTIVPKNHFPIDSKLLKVSIINGMSELKYCPHCGRRVDLSDVYARLSIPVKLV